MCFRIVNEQDSENIDAISLQIAKEKDMIIERLHIGLALVELGFVATEGGLSAFTWFHWIVVALVVTKIALILHEQRHVIAQCIRAFLNRLP
jgi:hypothetical protein